VKRIVWFIIGTLVGVYLVTRLKRRAQALAPESLQASAEKMASAIRHFGDEVRAGMAERETELRDALGIDTTTDAATTQTQREDYR
jgi:F0F1-type ATP synthase membrane subunit a